LALSKTAILAEGPRRTRFEVWPEWNMTGRNRSICVRPCAERTYVSRKAEKVVRVLTKNGAVGGTAAGHGSGRTRAGQDAENAKDSMVLGSGIRQHGVAGQRSS